MTLCLQRCLSVRVSVCQCVCLCVCLSAKTNSELDVTWYDNVLLSFLEVMTFWLHLTLTFDLEFWPWKLFQYLGRPNTTVWEISLSTRHAANAVTSSPCLSGRACRFDPGSTHQTSWKLTLMLWRILFLRGRLGRSLNISYKVWSINKSHFTQMVMAWSHKGEAVYQP